jgi:hypothetical protein
VGRKIGFKTRQYLKMDCPPNCEPLMTTIFVPPGTAGTIKSKNYNPATGGYVTSFTGNPGVGLVNGVPTYFKGQDQPGFTTGNVNAATMAGAKVINNPLTGKPYGVNTLYQGGGTQTWKKLVKAQQEYKGTTAGAILGWAAVVVAVVVAVVTWGAATPLVVAAVVGAGIAAGSQTYTATKNYAGQTTSVGATKLGISVISAVPAVGAAGYLGTSAQALAAASTPATAAGQWTAAGASILGKGIAGYKDASSPGSGYSWLGAISPQAAGAVIVGAGKVQAAVMPPGGSGTISAPGTGPAASTATNWIKGGTGLLAGLLGMLAPGPGPGGPGGVTMGEGTTLGNWTPWDSRKLGGAFALPPATWIGLALAGAALLGYFLFFRRS